MTPLRAPSLRRAALAALVALAGCGKSTDDRVVAGYVESDLVYLSSQEGGQIASVEAREGDSLAAGAVVVRLDAERLSLSIRQAELQAAAAAERAGEGGALARAVAEAEADADVARKNLARVAALKREGYATAERADAAKANAEAAEARLARTRAERDEQKKQAEARAAEVALWKRRLADLTVRAPVAGVVDRLYRRPGEVVAPGETVASLRPPANVKLRFYAPQARLSALAVGGRVAYACDGCPAGLEADISYIAKDPQFTPPVIYSREERDALVFLVEARPAPGGPPLAEGQPVDVVLP